MARLETRHKSPQRRLWPRLRQWAEAHRSPLQALPNRPGSGKRQASHVSSQFRQSKKGRKPSAVGKGFTFLFFGIFFLVGLAVIGFGTLYPLAQSLMALGWEKTPCTVDSSQVLISRSSKGGATYRPEVVYHYRCEGQTYTAKRYQFSTGYSSGKDRKQRVVDQYPAGRETVCYVNTSKPSEAVIYRGLNVEMLYGLFGIPFAAVGALGLFYFPRLAGRQYGQYGQLSSQKKAVPTFTPASAEPAPLKSQLSPLGQFLGITAFALFWNGFIGVFVYMIFFRHADTTPWFAKAFILVFALIGVLLLLAAGSSFMALFNPRVLLSARTNAVPLGGVYQFEWRVKGRADRLRKMRIVLEGREEAWYPSGKSQQSATQVFAEIPIVQTMDNEPVDGQGQGRVTIPAGLMHSFNSVHNKIVWRLHVHAEVAHFPAVDEDYLLNVLPHGSST